MTDTILVINAGSSSIKFYLYDIDGAQELAPRLGGQLEGIGTSHPKLRVRDAAGAFDAILTLDGKLTPLSDLAGNAG